MLYLNEAEMRELARARMRSRAADYRAAAADAVRLRRALARVCLGLARGLSALGERLGEGGADGRTRAHPQAS